MRGSTAFRRPRWQSHSDTAISQSGLAGCRAAEIPTPCNVEVQNHSQTT